MRLNNFIILIIFIYFSGTGIACAETCMSASPSDCSGWRGDKKWCDLSEAEKSQVQLRPYSCQKDYRSYVLIIGMVSGGWDFYTVPCVESECKEKTVCEKYKELFNPPPADCKFERFPEVSCKDGEGSLVWSTEVIKASDGRTASTKSEYGDQSRACTTYLHLTEGCDADPIPDSCFEPVPPESGEDGGPAVGCSADEKKVCIDPDNCAENWICVKKDDGSTDPSTPKPDECMKSITKDGVTQIVDVCVDTDINVTYPEKCYKKTCTTDKDGGEACILENLCANNGESGGNTGGNTGGETGGETEGETEGEGGTGLEGWDPGPYGEGKLKEEQKGLYDRLGNSSELNKIKNHKYVKISGSTCKISFSVFRKSFEITLCDWESKIRLLGSVLKAIVGIGGVLLILRGGK